MIRFTLWLGCLALVIAACDTGETGPDVSRLPVVSSSVVTNPVTTSPVATSPVTTSQVTTSPINLSPVLDVPGALRDFGIGTVRLAGGELTVAIADDDGLRPRGLMHVTDLGSLAGMVFVWPEDTQSTFWMKDTLISLDIAWFDSDGNFVSGLTMPVCPSNEVCPNYAADARYRFALEMPAGTMPDLDSGSRLELIEGF
jgi:uncharacterized membrane protein (UPF0127 family)